MSLPCYSFTHFIGFAASQVGFMGWLMTGFMMFTWSWERLSCEMNAYDASSGLRLRQGALQNCWVEKCSLCPWGNSSYNWLIVFLQAVSCSTNQRELLTVSGFWSPSETRRSSSQIAVAAVCVRKMNAWIQPSDLAPWPPGPRFYSELPNRLWRTLETNIDWGKASSLNKSKVCSPGVYRRLVSTLHQTRSHNLSRHWSEKVRPFF